MSDDRCHDCPVPAGATCWASLPGNGRYCGLKRDQPRYAGMIARLSGRAAPAGFPRARSGAGKVRVGFVSAGLCIGGAERHMLCVASWLDRDRFDFAGIAIRAGGIVQDPMADEWRRLGIPWAIGPAAIRSLYRECDICYVWGVPAAEQLLSERPSTCKALVVSHGICDWTRAAMADAARADEVVITAKASLDTIPESERHRVKLIYNAIDPARLAPKLSRAEQRAAWGIDGPDVRICGNVARISGEKGCYHAAPMIDELWRYGSKEWRFVWVGPGFETEAARVRADALVPGGVILPGHTEDVGSAHNAFDHYVAPTIDDAHPLSLVEAMLSKTPIISASVGYASEHPELFRLVPKAPSGWHLAQALAADLSDPAGSAARVERAYAYAMAELTPPRFVREWTSLLDGMAPGSRDGVPCRWRREEAGCCGPIDRCRAPGHRRHGASVMTRECLACVEAGERPE